VKLCGECSGAKLRKLDEESASRQDTDTASNWDARDLSSTHVTQLKSPKMRDASMATVERTRRMN